MRKAHKTNLVARKILMFFRVYPACPQPSVTIPVRPINITFLSPQFGSQKSTIYGSNIKLHTVP